MIKKLFKNGLLAAGVLVAMMINSSAVAQDEEITDEDLKIYAAGMTKIDSVKKEVSAEYVQLIKDEEVLKGRFNVLKKANGDEAKLAEIEATPEEIAAYNKIQETYATMKTDLNETSKDIIMSEIGAKIYNKVKKGLRTDAGLKAKYEEIVDSMKPEEGEEGDT